MKKLFFLLVLLNLFQPPSFCQNQDLVDSLQTQLKNHNASRQGSGKKAPLLYDTTAVQILNKLSRVYYGNDPAKQMDYAQQALSLAEKIGYKKGMGGAYNNIGVVHMMNGNYLSALEFYKKALRIAEEIRNKRDIAGNSNNIGLIYQYQGNYPEALKIYFSCLKIMEELGNKNGVATIYNNIGNIYQFQGNYPEALKHQLYSLKMIEESGDKLGISRSYHNIGNTYQKQGNYPEALKNQFIALKIAEEIAHKAGIAYAYTSIGEIYQEQGNYPDALKYQFAALKIKQEQEDKDGIAASYYNIGIVYTKQKNYNDASVYMNKALSLSKEIGSLEGIKESYEGLGTIDSALGNFKQGLSHYKLYISTRDSLVNNENSKKIVQQQMQYDFDKKEDSLKQQQVITETRLTAQKKQRYFYWGGIAMLSVLSVFVFLNFRNQKKINRLAAESHERQKNEMELQGQQAILHERLRISSELHDEVGATLSGIAMYSHLTKEQMKAGQTTEIEKSLNVMQQSSAQMVDKLNDIVWLINPEQDSLQKLIERLEEYARDMAVIKNMQVKITVPDKLAEINLPTDSRRNIYLFCKEAINNAVKYSNGSVLELTLKEMDNKLEFSVSDNGKGFDAVMVRRGNGLENMQKRADEIGAKLTLQSKLNEGAYLSLQCEITH